MYCVAMTMWYWQKYCMAMKRNNVMCNGLLCGSCVLLYMANINVSILCVALLLPYWNIIIISQWPTPNGVASLVPQRNSIVYCVWRKKNIIIININMCIIVWQPSSNGSNDRKALYSWHGMSIILILCVAICVYCVWYYWQWYYCDGNDGNESNDLLTYMCIMSRIK